ncbi:MAG: energy-coupling factor transporter transmembrane protein EcfT [Clostridia bacterium]|nr:energy-coupling factor transporter transmembrane protein EcfT [Clostridia bacterium]
MNSAKKSDVYPLLGIAISVFVIVFGLITAAKDNRSCCIFLAGVFTVFLFTGFHRSCIGVILPAFAVAAIFGLITYLSGRGFDKALSIGLRFIAIGIAMIPGMSIRPVDLTRNLNELRVPRGITLGMLIALNFTPLLGAEIKQIREAMKTRGAGSVINFKILYRAFLIPLIMRLVNISDTLALSVETRGFTLDGKDISVYKRVSPHIKDGVVAALIAVCAAGALTV